MSPRTWATLRQLFVIVAISYYGLIKISYICNITAPEAYNRCSEKISTDISHFDLDLILDCSLYSANLILLSVNSA